VLLRNKTQNLYRVKSTLRQLLQQL